MSRRLVATALTLLLLLAGATLWYVRRPAPPVTPLLPGLTSPAMTLTSTAFAHQGFIPSQHACDSKDVSPPLNISGVPEAARSLALIVDDPDAPRGDWVHWTIWNIDPRTAAVGEGAALAGAIEGQTDFGRPGYGGPCPPSGTHRYFFKLYALDTTLGLPASSRKAELERAMEGHILEQATLIGLYRRH